MDYYSVLNAEKDSGDIEIKKLYFKQVKEYPPEKFPEKFKEIRMAYETLSDPKLKRAYNEKLSIPKIVEETLKSVERLLFNDEYGEAIRILQSLESDYPKVTAIKIKLAKAYLENENHGKAVKIMEKVVKIEKDNPEHLAFLAHAYSMRGFNKKAISAFRESLALDASDYAVWIKMTGLLINYNKKLLIKSIDEMLAADKTYNWENIEIFFIALKGKRGLLNQKEIDEFVDKIIELKDMNYIFTPVQYATIVAKNIGYLDADYISQENIDKLNVALMDLASKDDAVNEVIDELKALQLLGDFMDDPIFDPTTIDLINILARKLHLDEMEGEFFLIESFIAGNKNKFRKELLHLKNNYLHLYNLNRYFFDCVLNEKNPQPLIEYMIKREEETEDFISEILGESDYEKYEPYVREEPKIGRNDPCPCGSGKKYKKCCALN